MVRKSQTFNISNYPWDVGGYQPKTTATLSYDDEYFEVYFKSYETNIRAVETEHNTDIYCDSCVEFFGQFDLSQTTAYINFEMNANGAVYCAVGPNRDERILIDPKIIDTFERRTKISEDYWEAWLKFPVSFIKEQYPKYEHKEGAVFRGNFYKCGDKTERPHFLCWSNIIWDEPDFHRPEFFSEITL